MLQLTPDGRLHFHPELPSYFEPMRGSKGRVTGVNYFALDELHASGCDAIGLTWHSSRCSPALRGAVTTDPRPPSYWG